MYKETLWERYSAKKINEFMETTEYKNLVAVLDDLFPDRYEIKADDFEQLEWGSFKFNPNWGSFNNQVKDYFINVSKLSYFKEKIGINIILHYPVINIKNRDNLTHVIRDLYVKLIIPCFREKLIDLDGLRTTLTKNEFVKGYAHSHLPSNSYKITNTSEVEDKWSNFCVGSSELGCCHQTDVLNTDKMKILQFFFLLQAYLEYESIEGVPYIKLENCRNLSDLVKFNFDNSQYNYIKLKKPPIKLNKELKIVNKEEVEEWLIENKVDKIATKIEGKYYSVLSKDRIEFLKESNNQEVFKFRNQIIKLKIDNYANKTEVKKFPHPKFTEKFISYWEQRIHETYINKFGSCRTKAKSKTNIAIESNEPSIVSM